MKNQKTINNIVIFVTLVIIPMSLWHFVSFFAAFWWVVLFCWLCVWSYKKAEKARKLKRFSDMLAKMKKDRENKI